MQECCIQGKAQSMSSISWLLSMCQVPVKRRSRRKRGKWVLCWKIMQRRHATMRRYKEGQLYLKNELLQTVQTVIVPLLRKFQSCKTLQTRCLKKFLTYPTRMWMWRQFLLVSSARNLCLTYGLVELAQGGFITCAVQMSKVRYVITACRSRPA